MKRKGRLPQISRSGSSGEQTMNDVKIYFENETDTEISSEILQNMKRVVEKTVELEYDSMSFEVSITIVSDETIKSLNAEYRGKDAVTDVLSFPMDEFDDSSHTEPLGDIVIAIERAAKQAEEYGHSLMRELCFLTAHSTLHLLGYDHENGDEERLIMEQKQEEILNSLNITRDI